MDHAGAPVESWALDDATVEIGGFALDLHGVKAINGPPPFRGWGIGGFLSPENLHPGYFTVIDLVDDRLLLVDGRESDLCGWLASRHPKLHVLTLERSGGTWRGGARSRPVSRWPRLPGQGPPGPRRDAAASRLGGDRRTPRHRPCLQRRPIEASALGGHPEGGALSDQLRR